MAHAKMEDVKVIWYCLSDGWYLSLGEGDESFCKDRGEDGWLALEKCLSMTDDEFWFLIASDVEEEDEPFEQSLYDMREALEERVRKAIGRNEGQE